MHKDRHRHAHIHGHDLRMDTHVDMHMDMRTDTHMGRCYLRCARIIAAKARMMSVHAWDKGMRTKRTNVP